MNVYFFYEWIPLKGSAHRLFNCRHSAIMQLPVRWTFSLHWSNTNVWFSDCFPATRKKSQLHNSMGPPVTQEEFQCLVMSLEQLLQRLCRTEVNTTQHSNNTPATPPILAKSGWSLKGNSLSAVAVRRFSLTHRLLQAVVSARMRNAELRPGKVHDSRLGILGRGFLKKEGKGPLTPWDHGFSEPQHKSPQLPEHFIWKETMDTSLALPGVRSVGQGRAAGKPGQAPGCFYINHIVSLKLPPPIGRARFENTLGNPFYDLFKYCSKRSEKKILNCNYIVLLKKSAFEIILELGKYLTWKCWVGADWADSVKISLTGDTDSL